MNPKNAKVLEFKPGTTFASGSEAERPTQVGIWIRVSTEDQARGESPEHHEHRARSYAESKGWTVREVYHLEAVSGKTVLQHPEAQRMLADVKAGRIGALIFSKLARLARNTRELLDFADLFQAHGADLVSLQEAIDTSTPAGRLFYTMLAAMAQWEREEIASRVAASIPIRAKLGKPLGGQAPLGYRWVDKKLVVDPAEAPLRKLIYELFLEHRRFKRVARLLNEMGHRTRGGARFCDTSVERLLTDPTAKGVRRANYTHSKGTKRRWVPKPESEWVYTPVEPIVSEALWNQCNHFIEERRRKGKRPSRAAAHLFGGLARCACGAKMYVMSGAAKYVCVKCRNKIPSADLDAVFYEQLKGFFFSPDEVARYLAQADQTIKDQEALRAVLEAEAAKVQAEMDMVYKLYLAGEITAQGFGARNRPLEARQVELADELPRLQGEIDFLKVRYLSSDAILTEARDLYSRWPGLSFEEKRQIVEHITEKIVVGEGDVRIELNYLPPFCSEDATTKQRNFREPPMHADRRRWTRNGELLANARRPRGTATAATDAHR